MNDEKSLQGKYFQVKKELGCWNVGESIGELSLVIGEGLEVRSLVIGHWSLVIKVSWNDIARLHGCMGAWGDGILE